MKVVIITQNDPFYLRESIEYLLENVPKNCEVAAVVLLAASPFGKRLSFKDKVLETLWIFGPLFLIRYGFKLVVSKIVRRDVKSLLVSAGIPVLRLDASINAPSSLELILRYSPDLLVSIAGNEIFKRPLIDLAPKGCLNLHTALLPKYRGLMPSFWVLRNQEQETGVSVFFVDEGIDSGPILVQKRILIEGMSQQELIRTSKKVGIEAVLEAISKVNDGDVECFENKDSEKSYYGFPTRSDVLAFRKAGGRFF